MSDQSVETYQSLVLLRSRCLWLAVVFLSGFLLSVAIGTILSDQKETGTIAGLLIMLAVVLGAASITLWGLSALALARAIRALRSESRKASWLWVVPAVVLGPVGAFVSGALFVLLKGSGSPDGAAAPMPTVPEQSATTAIDGLASKPRVISRRVMIYAALLSLAAIAVGSLVALANPVDAATLARAALYTASRLAAPGILAIAAVVALVVRRAAKRNQGWQRFWQLVKLAYAVYAYVILVFVLFSAGVAVTNVARFGAFFLRTRWHAP